jgi:hypothetical protein
VSQNGEFPDDEHSLLSSIRKIMKVIKILAITVTIIMFLTLMYGFIEGDFFREGSILMSLVWGKVSLIDVYAGFVLFSGWVIFREQKPWIAFVWIIFIMVLGNFITGLYVTIALYRCNGDFNLFWLGKFHKKQVEV